MSTPPQATRIAISEANYHIVGDADRRTLRLAPRRKETTLIDGTAQVDARGRLQQVEGRLAKSPSFWVRSVTVRRTYQAVSGHALPVRVESVADVKLAGACEFSMWIDYTVVDGIRIDRVATRPRMSGSEPSHAARSRCADAARHRHGATTGIATTIALAPVRRRATPAVAARSGLGPGRGRSRTAGSDGRAGLGRISVEGRRVGQASSTDDSHDRATGVDVERDLHSLLRRRVCGRIVPATPPAPGPTARRPPAPMPSAVDVQRTAHASAVELGTRQVHCRSHDRRDGGRRERSARGGQGRAATSRARHSGAARGGGRGGRWCRRRATGRRAATGPPSPARPS